MPFSEYANRGSLGVLLPSPTMSSRAIARKTKAVVHQLAQKLKSDGFRVWLDAWEIRAGNNIPAKIEEGLERSYVLVLRMSGNAFGSDRATLESRTFRFRDPLNKERRFIPLRLDDAKPKGSIIQFSYVDWCDAGVEAEYMRLLRACRPNGSWPEIYPPYGNDGLHRHPVRRKRPGTRWR